MTQLYWCPDRCGRKLTADDLVLSLGPDWRRFGLVAVDNAIPAAREPANTCMIEQLPVSRFTRSPLPPPRRPLTVSQVITALAALPADLIVYLSTEDNWYPATTVECSSVFNHDRVEIS